MCSVGMWVFSLIFVCFKFYEVIALYFLNAWPPLSPSNCALMRRSGLPSFDSLGL